MKIVNYLLINLIKFYKYFISPIFGQNCRFLPTCSEYFIECLKVHGTTKGLYLGIKRMGKCHPIKILGGNSGLDLVPKKEITRKYMLKAEKKINDNWIIRTTYNYSSPVMLDAPDGILLHKSSVRDNYAIY